MDPTREYETQILRSIAHDAYLRRYLSDLPVVEFSLTFNLIVIL